LCGGDQHVDTVGPEDKQKEDQTQWYHFHRVAGAWSGWEFRLGWGVLAGPSSGGVGSRDPQLFLLEAGSASLGRHRGHRSCFMRQQECIAPATHLTSCGSRKWK
jgi:hypothetical protein